MHLSFHDSLGTSAEIREGRKAANVFDCLLAVPWKVSKISFQHVLRAQRNSLQ